METRGAGARWTRLDARAVATEVSLSGAARTRDAGVEGEDDDDDDWVVVRAPARRDDDDGEVSSEVADDEAEDGDGDGDGDVNVETMDEDEGADARGKREMDAMDAIDAIDRSIAVEATARCGGFGRANPIVRAFARSRVHAFTHARACIRIHPRGTTTDDCVVGSWGTKPLVYDPERRIRARISLYIENQGCEALGI